MPSILIVEDEEIISNPFAMVLRMQKYDVDVAANGLEALECCKHKDYDLILLDYIMPLCNGAEFLQKASLKKKSPNTKVIMMSNLAGGKEIDATLKLGADSSILKSSVTPKFLIELVYKELNNHES